jgi:hypothetical protein
VRPEYSAAACRATNGGASRARNVASGRGGLAGSFDCVTVRIGTSECIAISGGVAVGIAGSGTDEPVGETRWHPACWSGG